MLSVQRQSTYIKELKANFYIETELKKKTTKKKSRAKRDRKTQIDNDRFACVLFFLFSSRMHQLWIFK